MNQSTFVTPSQLSCELGITEATLYRWVRDGKFPAPLRLGLRHYVWLRCVIENHYTEKQEQAEQADKD